MRCIVCGKEFKCKPSEVERGRRFCSRSCKGVCFGGPKRGVYGVMGEIIEESGDLVEGIDVPIKTVNLDSEREAFLVKVRRSIKQTGHAYKYDSGGLVVGEYDVDGNLKEY